MKVKNFINSNYRYFSTGSEVYRGLVQMTEEEYKKVIKYLLKCKLEYKEIFKKDLKNIETFRGGYQLTFRVEATEKMFNHFNLPRYKQQNYIIQVITK